MNCNYNRGGLEDLKLTQVKSQEKTKLSLTISKKKLYERDGTPELQLCELTAFESSAHPVLVGI